LFIFDASSGMEVALSDIDAAQHALSKAYSADAFQRRFLVGSFFTLSPFPDGLMDKGREVCCGACNGFIY
jgi:hypothetical protein